MFLIYINDITENIESEIFLFADDASLLKVIRNDPLGDVEVMNSDLGKIQAWSNKWKLPISVEKTKAILFSKKINRSFEYPLFINNLAIENVKSHKHLGLLFSASLSWIDHIRAITTKAASRINLMKQFKYKWTRKSLETCYLAFVRPLLEYGDIVFNNCDDESSELLENTQLEAIRLILGAKIRTSHDELLRESGLCSLKRRREFHILLKFAQCVHGVAPRYLVDLLPDKMGTRRVTRGHDSNLFILYACNTEYFRRSFFPCATRLWNCLEIPLRSCDSFVQFRNNYYLSANIRFKVNKYYYMGTRTFQITMAQIRVNFSNLNNHLYDKHCIDSPNCSCGAPTESVEHYFLECPKFRIVRNEFLAELNETFNFVEEINDLDVLDILLHGAGDIVRNQLFSRHLEQFIVKTNRFVY